MILEKRFYQDPALHAKFERERIPCYGCKHLIAVFDKQCCDKGHKTDKRCDQFADKTL